MDTIKENPAAVKRGVQVILVVLGIIGLYYLYRYLFASTQPSYSTLLSNSQSATTSPSSPITIPAANMTPLYEGGTFTLSTWIYLNNWNYRLGMNKHILSIGGNTFDTIRMYLSPFTTQLNVRLQTSETSAVPPGSTAVLTVPSANTIIPTSTAAPASPPSQSQSGPAATLPSTMSDNLLASNAVNLFSTLQTNTELTTNMNICDLPYVDMQRWVNITVSVDGRTCDVYMDGKLARSCVLPSFYKVDVGYSASLLNYGGFGGYMGNTILNGKALNPADIYALYNAGPTSSSFFGNLSSALTPSSM